MFNISAADLPSLRTRKALLVIDLQNDFCSPDGPLRATEPEGFVSRTLQFVKTFRESGAGNVVWIRSEFESARKLSATGDQIITTDMPISFRPQRRSNARGRQPTSAQHEDAAREADEEAFLSGSKADGDEQLCVRPGTHGAQFTPDVQMTVDSSRDFVFTKSHYSAFAGTTGPQLLQLLRGRFVTEIFVCGALTNISIYATALDAGQHGYEIYLLEDCCGYRHDGRHANAVRQLAQLIGSEPMLAEEAEKMLKPSLPAIPSRPPFSGGAGGGIGVGSAGAGGGQETPVRPSAPRNQSTGLSPTISKLSLKAPGPPAGVGGKLSPAQPQAQSQSSRAQPIQPLAAASKLTAAPTSRTGHVNSAPLDADSLGSDSRQKQPDDDGSSAKITSHASEQSSGELKGPLVRSDSDGSSAKDSHLRTSTAKSLKGAVAEDDAAISPVDKTSTQTGKATSDAQTVRAEATTRAAKSLTMDSPPSTTATVPAPLCEGDTAVVSDVLPPSLAKDAFELLKSEVSWAGMSHLGGEVPRRVAVQGAIDEAGNMPVYRHPSDESPPLLPFSPTVLRIKKEVEKQLGHPLNHVLIQLYRDGKDYISEHSDKTLDIVRGSYIANVSLGAQRTMVFRRKRAPKDKSATPAETKESEDDDSEAKGTKKAKDAGGKREVVRAPLPHNSLCRVGLETNMRWLHAIKQDKRAEREKQPEELAFNGERISLTFRHIGTFLDASQSRIWGQGATSKTKEGAKPVVNGQTEEAVKMLTAFGAENNRPVFDWDETYGGGFDVLHMGTPKRFYTGKDAVVNASVGLALAELGFGCAKGVVEGAECKFEDNDVAHTTVEGGHLAVLHYLDGAYGLGRRNDHFTQQDLAQRVDRFYQADALLRRWREARQTSGLAQGGDDLTQDVRGKALTGLTRVAKKELALFEGYAGTAKAAAAKEAQGQEGPAFYLGGDAPSNADFILWPVLHDMVNICGEGVLEPSLKAYYLAFKARSTVAKVLGTTSTLPTTGSI